jgi:response regulator of citrate/malate metabolism
MGGIRVMVVEDDFMVADINRQVVEQVEGFAVTKVARNGREALDEIEAGAVDLVILDVYLPDVHGIEVLKEARRRDAVMDFILITAAHDAKTVEESMRYGVYDYIIKPFDFDRFKDALREYRKRREALAQTGYFDQGRLDTVLEKKSAARVRSDLPKGIASQTLDKVIRFIDGTVGEITAADMMEKLELSRVTAHRYLDFLTESGRLRKELRYKKVGRPAVYYERIPPT